jgi:hypothetical protein
MCPVQTLQYSYKLGSSTPIGYPKYEMEFPHRHSTRCWRSRLESVRIAPPKAYRATDEIQPLAVVRFVRFGTIDLNRLAH